MTKALLILLQFSFAAHAATRTISHFTPGKYSLESGEMKLCGEGDFYISKDGKRLWLGPYYSFSSKAGTVKEQGGSPAEKGCFDETKTTMGIEDGKTVFTEVDTLKCGQVIRHVITNKATLADGKVSLEQSQEVNQQLHYKSGGVEHSCAWALAKPKK